MMNHRVMPRRTGLMPVLRMASMDIPEPMRKRVRERDLWEKSEIALDTASGIST